MTKTNKGKNKQSSQKTTDYPPNQPDYPPNQPEDMDPPLIPENFKSVITDFINDLTTTFPDYKYLWVKWTAPELPQSELQYLFEYLLKIYPERFFDILYQNEEIFSQTTEINTHFLPDVDFRILYNCADVSKTTQKSIWKYLQLILFTIINTIKDKSKFGDTKDIFEGINEEELQTKLSETILSITDFFTNINNQDTSSNPSSPPPSFPNPQNAPTDDGNEPQPDLSDFADTAKKMFENMSGSMPSMANFENMKNSLPNPEELHEHLKGLFDGKIGKLAKELAEEISGDFSDLLDKNDNEIKTTQDVLNKLMKDPAKMMNLMKTVSNKITKKMKDGELSQDEIMKEAGDLIGKMKDMGGMEQFNEMFKNLKQQMGGGMGKNMKMDTNAMGRLSKQQALKQRLKERLDVKRQQEATATAIVNASKTVPPPVNKAITNYSIEPSNSNPDNFVFKMGDSGVQEKSMKDENKKNMDAEIDNILLSINNIKSDAKKPTNNKTSTDAKKGDAKKKSKK